MILTDTHAHIYSESFEADRDEMMQRAIDSGVQRFFVPALDASYMKSMYEIEKKYPEKVFLMAGLHPTYVKENYKEELRQVEEALAQRSKETTARKFYAVGEIGIDLYWDQSRLKEQQYAFQYQIQLAKKFKLPIVIHCRNAFDEVFEVLESEKEDDLFGIFHCFTGTFEQAKKAIQYQMKLGIGGVVTFKKGKIDTFLREIDLDHIVLETDAPYLSPVPYRGKRNESAYLIHILAKLSEIYELPKEKIAEITTQNSVSIFKV